MSNEAIRETAERIAELGNEVESPGHVAVEEASLMRTREVLRQWADGVKGVVLNPAMGRVTVIDANGRPSSIASAELVYLLSAADVTRAG